VVSSSRRSGLLGARGAGGETDKDASGTIGAAWIEELETNQFCNAEVVAFRESL